MSKEVKYCKKCLKEPELYFNKVKTVTGWSDEEIRKHFTIGYYTPRKERKMKYCDYHTDEILEESNFTFEEYNLIEEISTDISFVQSMEQLKEKDPIEFQLKLAQFKSTTVQQESVKPQKQNVPKCPTCGSTKLSKVSAMSKAGSVIMWGLFSQKVKKTWHCGNCGYEW